MKRRARGAGSPPRHVGISRSVVILTASVGGGHDGPDRELHRRLLEQGHRSVIADLTELAPMRLGRLLRAMLRAQLLVAPTWWGRAFRRLDRVETVPRHTSTPALAVKPAVRPEFTRPAFSPTGGNGNRDDDVIRFGQLLPDRPLALLSSGAWAVGQVRRTALDLMADTGYTPVVLRGSNHRLRRRLNRHHEDRDRNAITTAIAAAAA